MNDRKAKAVTGENNQRLMSDDPIKNEGTAAWSHTEKIIEESQVTVPSEEHITEAREWVDDGSKL